MQKTNERKRRMTYAIVFFILVIVEVLIALFVRDSFIRPYIGDVLVVIVLYFGVRIAIPYRCRMLPLYIFLFAALVEVLQYFRLVDALGLSNNRLFRVLLGSVFDVKDIICYGVGCIWLGLFEWRIRKNRDRNRDN